MNCWLYSYIQTPKRQDKSTGFRGLDASGHEGGHQLRREKAESLETTAAQVHVGAHILGEDINIWRQYLKTYEAYESVLFRFFCGDKVNKRANINFGRPISDVLHKIDWSKIKSFNELIFIFQLNHLLKLKSFLFYFCVLYTR